MTMVVPQVDVETNNSNGMRKAGSTTNLNGTDSKDRDMKLPPGPSTTQTWPFVEVVVVVSPYQQIKGVTYCRCIATKGISILRHKATLLMDIQNCFCGYGF